jgi:hypothetical protein
MWPRVWWVPFSCLKAGGGGHVVAGAAAMWLAVTCGCCSVAAAAPAREQVCRGLWLLDVRGPTRDARGLWLAEARTPVAGVDRGDVGLRFLQPLGQTAVCRAHARRCHPTLPGRGPTGRGSDAFLRGRWASPPLFIYHSTGQGLSISSFCSSTTISACCPRSRSRCFHRPIPSPSRAAFGAGKLFLCLAVCVRVYRVWLCLSALSCPDAARHTRGGSHARPSQVPSLCRTRMTPCVHSAGKG